MLVLGDQDSGLRPVDVVPPAGCCGRTAEDPHDRGAELGKGRPFSAEDREPVVRLQGRLCRHDPVDLDGGHRTAGEPDSPHDRVGQCWAGHPHPGFLGVHGLDVTSQPPHDVDVMDSDLDRQVRPGREQLAFKAGHAAAGRHRHDAADRAAPDRLVDGQVIRGKPQRMPDHQPPGLRRWHGDQGIGVGQRVRDWFLAEDIQALLQRPHGHLAVGLLGGAHEHRFEPRGVQQLTEVAGDRDPGRRACHRGRIDIAAGQQVRQRRSRQHPGMLLPDHPEPHHGAPHWPHLIHPQVGHAPLPLLSGPFFITPVRPSGVRPVRRRPAPPRDPDPMAVPPNPSQRTNRR